MVLQLMPCQLSVTNRSLDQGMSEGEIEFSPSLFCLVAERLNRDRKRQQQGAGICHKGPPKSVPRESHLPVWPKKAETSADFSLFRPSWFSGTVLVRSLLDFALCSA